MFYSPRDVEATIGADLWRQVLTDKNSPIRKIRNLTGTFETQGHRVTLVDWYGAFNTSLDKAMRSVGVDNPWKSLVADKGYDKSDMGLFFLDCPNEAVRYAVGDVVYLAEATQARLTQVLDVIEGALGFRPSWNLEDFPRSSGSLVAKTFEQWLMHRHPKLYRAVLCLSDTPNNRLWSELRTIKNDLVSNGDLGRANNLLRSSDYLHGMAQGSIKAWGSHAHESLGLFNAVVMGGRCLNEEPYEDVYRMKIHNVLDIDLSSCYGSALRSFDYPFGIPTFVDHKVDDDPMTLGDFLDSTGHELVPGLWQVVVSGHLPFLQDLLYSKYDLDTRKLSKTIGADLWASDADTSPDDREDNDAHVGGTFLLTRQQLQNAIVTHEVLEVLKAVSTDREWKAIRNLQVVTAAYYPRSLEMTREDWADKMLDPKSRGTKKGKADTRSRHWCRLGLDGFIGDFIAYRKTIKAKIQTKGDAYDLLQNSVKLFVNTTYGNLAAPYFPMGNTILANNITAKARTGVWMLSKALLTVQSITDGGMFSYDRVAFLRPGKRPGLNVLADRTTMLAHRSIRTGRLGDGRDWFQHVKDATPTDLAYLDQVCLDHINNFWSVYGLRLPFDIECKYEHTARQAVYFGSSDYRIDETVSGRPVVKCRGAKDPDHPKQLFLAHLAYPDVYPVPESYYEYTELLGVNEFQKDPNRWPEHLPGMDIVKSTVHRPYKWGRSYLTYQDYKKDQERIERDIRRSKAYEESLETLEGYRTAQRCLRYLRPYGDQ
jgi:hypothetical protein